MHNKTLVACGLAALAAWPPPASADAMATVAASDIVVTAELEERRLHALDTPSFGVGIAAAQLGAVNAVNAEDLLRYAPATIVRKRYAGDPNATLSFRNMHSQQTPRALVLVDGFPISNFLGADWDTAPKWGVLAPDDIGRVEIVYGPTSAHYSGHSMGGTMLIETQPIRETAVRLSMQGLGQHYGYYKTDADYLGWSIDGGVEATLGSRGGVALSYRHFRNRGQPMEWRMAAAGTPYAGQAIVDPELPFLRVAAEDSPVDTTEDQLRARGHYDLGGGWEVHGLAALLVQRDDAAHPQSFLRDAAGQPTFVGVEGVSANVARRSELLTGVALEGALAGWTTRLRYSRFDTLRNRTRTSDNYDVATGLAPRAGRVMDVDGRWQNLALDVERTFDGHAIAIGVALDRYAHDARTDNLSDWATGQGGPLRDASHGRTRLLGLYAEDKVTVGRVTATFGLRYESWRAWDGRLVDGGADVRYPARRADAWSPKLALRFAPDDATELTASFALATRFPTVRELYQPGLVQYGADAGALDLNGFNPDLKPEKAVDVQLTAMRRFGNLHVTLDAYRQDVRDTIFAQSIAVPDPASGALVQNTLVTNIGKVRSWGADLVVSAEHLLVKGLALDANLSWIDATITDNPLNRALVGNRFPRIPTWRVNASLRYAPDPAWDFAINLRHQSTPDRNLENNATSKCGTFFCVTRFSFVDLRARHRMGAVELSAGVDNLFDEKAFVYHPYPGRSFIIGLKWKGAL